MNNIELNIKNKIHINLYYDVPINLDLALFYQTKNNQSNGILSMEYTGKKEYEGCLEHFPYINIGRIMTSIALSKSLFHRAGHRTYIYDNSSAIDGNKTDFSTFSNKMLASIRIHLGMNNKNVSSI